MTKYISAIYGLVQFESQKYLIVVTDSSFSANIADHLIFKATKFEFIPLSSLSEDNDKDLVKNTLIY